VQHVPEDKRSFVEEVRILLAEQEDHRRREEDLRSSSEQMLNKEEPLSEKAKEEPVATIR
jgi:hypothetical protein